MNNYVPIGEVCYIFDGPHATPTKTSAGPVYLGIDAITDDGKINPAEYSYLSEEDYRIWTKRVTPQKNDIVFSYEATLGRYAMIPEGFYGCLGRRLAIVRAKDDRINPFWLYYYFLSPEWDAFISNHTVKGSTVNRISVEDFPRFPIPLPERNVQDAIVDVLSAIDKKIQNSAQLCSELEIMSKSIYNYWFTQFDFPNVNGNPYRSSGGAMEWNEQLKRYIPKGWKVCNFLEIAAWEGTSQPPKSTFSYEPKEGYVRFIQNRDYDGDGHITYIPLDRAKGLCNERDILIDKYGDAGKVRFGLAGAYNVALSKIRVFSETYREYVRSYLSTDPIYKYLHGSSMASTRASLNETHFSFLNIVIPPDTIISEFNNIMSLVIEKRLHANSENSELRKLRDWLLPMLMNGQATVD